MIWNETKECMAPDDLKAMQSKRLRKQVERMYLQVPYFRQKMQKLDLHPSDIESIDDIRKLPFTTKEDMRDNYPTGLFASPLSEIVRLHASSGTTGKATIVGYTKKDIDIWTECVARVLSMADIGRNDIIQIAYGYGLFTGGLGLHYGGENIGATVIPMSTSNTRKQLQMMEDLKCTAIACTPSYLLHLMEEVKAQGLEDQICLKAAICGGEPWTEEMREEIESQLKIKAYDIYGLSEIIGPGVAADCKEHKGLHIYEDHFYPEIVHPETLEPVEEGEVGELVITTLTKEGMPMIRYRTKDLTSLSREKCSCGRTMARMSRFKGRSDDMLVLKGVNVFPSQVETALLELPETKPYYLIIVDRVNNMDQVEIQVEVEDEYFSDEIRAMENLQEKITKALKEAIGIQVKVRIVEPKTIERSTGKSTRVIDRRKLV
ncbi:MAG: phenylacetate--CoA ligase [Tissierellia bacterium]|nr:phenylacetate--CoA ligase [Tissierellia bacterium]